MSKETSGREGGGRDDTLSLKLPCALTECKLSEREREMGGGRQRKNEMWDVCCVTKMARWLCAADRDRHMKEKWKVANNGIKVFFIIQIGAQWPGKVKYNDKYIVMLNDGMMDVGGTGSRDITMSGQKQFHKGATDPWISSAQSFSSYYPKPGAPGLLFWSARLNLKEMSETWMLSRSFIDQALRFHILNRFYPCCS